MPVLDKKLGTGYRLLVAGRMESDDVPALAGERVILLGVVEGLEDLYGSCRVFIAPTRFAGGVPHKVHEAAAYGLPTVATGLIASQLNWKHDLDILAADSPVAFAECCTTLYEDKVVWEHIRTGALACVARDCAQDRFAASVGAVLAEVLPRNGRGRSAKPRLLDSDAKCNV
jgi:glycosyltransferase involved in cell wall biosynthesis